MKHYVIIIFLVLFNAGYLPAGDLKIDSLKKVLMNSGEDTTKVNVLNSIGWEFTNKGSYDSAVFYADKAKFLADKLHFKKGSASAYNTIGFVHYSRGNYDEALKFHYESLKTKNEISDQIGIADSYNNIGLVNEYQGNYPEALKNFLHSLKLYEQNGASKKRIATVIINIGTVYIYQQNNSEALNYFFKALEMMEQIGDKFGISLCYTDIGIAYLNQEKNDKALEYYFKALKIDEEIGNKVGMARHYNNIGIVYADNGNYDEALKYYFLGLQIREESKDRQGVALAYYNIGNVLAKQKKYAESEKYLNESLQKSIAIGSKEIQKDVYKSLADLADETGDIKKAYEYYKQFSEAKDSLLNETNSRQIADMKTKYETEKKENEIQLQQAVIEKQNITRYYLIGGFTLFVLFSAITLYFYNQKKKTAFRHQVAEMETKLLHAQMNPHFIFNSLNSIQSLILEEQPRLAREYIITFSRLMRAVLEQTRKKSISLTEEIETIRKYLDLEKLRFNNKFDYEISISEITETDLILFPPLLIQPFVENSIIHGISHKEDRGFIQISFRKDEDMLVCKIRDDGVGRSAAAEKKKMRAVSSNSIATQLARERLANLNGNGKRKSGKAAIQITDLTKEDGQAAGTNVEIYIPYKITND